MHALRLTKFTLLALFSLAVLSTRADTATNLADAVALVRETYHTDRQAFVAEKLELTEGEATKFWPLYKSYRADIDKLGDELIKLVLEYADNYPDVPEDRAAKLLKKYLTLEDEFGDARAKYFKRAGKILPASKALRWAQLENRMDLALRLQLAGNIPVIEGGKRKP
jgi:hypothetical protein